ncbi:MAG: Fe-only nitrogenase accessory protein AnfO [Solidesulfovibrio magneticus str. Maddingley MBC34]|uniref:Fe-only nitrogenase accessory protein AnfO n=1 Tax=Solidesulfovibrio magneticus str. Maddingley MBC34 TaxID=1206767 RepID=K6GEJ3_9BACT|nr:MAG: Fe-only nitrogenase accessory protein AnfO [Solidesulfovibrio magneticus str. Maddingley MBC34]
MKIAAYVDDNECLASPYHDGRLTVYDNTSGAWKPIRDVGLRIRADMRLADVKTAVRQAVAEMDGCSVFVSATTTGLVNAVLQEELGFHTWKSGGACLEQLDVVAAKEAELAATPPAPVPLEATAFGRKRCCGSQPAMLSPRRASAAPISLARGADGSSRVNLIEALENDASGNSRDVLWPILTEGAFSQLEILCAHVPRWFAGALEELVLEAEYRTVREGVLAVVSRKH